MDSQRIVESLRGQAFTFPDLPSLFADWPTSVNSHLEWLRAEVDDRLKSISSQRNSVAEDATALWKLQAADFGLFGSYWWPSASAENLRIMTFMSIWLFLWDDEIDTGVSDLATNYLEAQAYRVETLSFVRYSLRIETTEPSALPSNILIRSFEDIGARLRETCSLGK